MDSLVKSNESMIKEIEFKYSEDAKKVEEGH
jgi:hypothetical protein